MDKIPEGSMCAAKKVACIEEILTRCAVLIPIQIETDKQPFPAGILTYSCGSFCFWQATEKGKYEKILKIGINDLSIGALRGMLDVNKKV